MQRRQIVKNPERPSLRRRDQFFFALVNRQIGNRGHRQIQLHRLPVRAVIERNIDARLSSGVKQSALVRVFANHPGESAVRNSIRNFLPGLAVVTGLVQIRFVVVVLVHGRRDVRRARFERRRVQRIDLNPFRHHVFRRRDVRPVLAAVARQLNETVVGTHPNRSRLHRRLHHCKDGVVVLDARVVFRNRPAGRALPGFVVAREIGTDGLPALALVG